MSIDLGELEYEIRNSQDLSHVAPETVLDLIEEVRRLRAMASANQGAIVNSIIERTRTRPTDDEREARSELPQPSAEVRIEQAVAYIRAAWVGLTEPTPNTPAGAILAILRGERSCSCGTNEPASGKHRLSCDIMRAALLAAREAERG